MAAGDEAWMREAMALARTGMAAGQSPFGCVIVRAGERVAAAHNRVWASGDPTAHAEVTAIREACARLGTISLEGCALYSTCEPCPMCMAAIHWARVERVVYGAAIADAAAAGFHELQVAAAALVRMGGSPVALEAGVLAEECRALFEDWLASGRGRVY